MIANDTTEAQTRTTSLHLMAPWARLPGHARATPGTLGAETPAKVVTEAEQMPRRARYLVPRGLPRRDEVLAVCVVAVVLAHVLFAQLTILLAAAFYLITRVTRRRPGWRGSRRPARGPRRPVSPPGPPGSRTIWAPADTRPITCCTSPPRSPAWGPGCPGSCRSPWWPARPRPPWPAG